MPGSILDGLAARREELAKEQVRDLAVPRWENPRAALRIQPLDHLLIKKQLARIEKATRGARDAVELSANAALIAAATIEVVIGEGDGEAIVALHDLAEPLDLPSDATGPEIIAKLMLADGDVIACAGAVMRHSGYAERDLDADLAGE